MSAGGETEFLRSELGKLAREYPEQAESLPITASVDAIAERVGIATGESRLNRPAAASRA